MFKANPSLGGTTKNVTPKILRPIFEHQSKIGFTKGNIFISNFTSKDYASHVIFETSIRIIIKLILIFQMRGQRFFYRKVVFKVLLFKSIKGKISYLFNAFNL